MTLSLAKILYSLDINNLRDFLSCMICYEFDLCSNFSGFGSVFSPECSVLASGC